MNDLIQLNELSEHQKVLISMLKVLMQCAKSTVFAICFLQARRSAQSDTAVLFRGMMMPTLF